MLLKSSWLYQTIMYVTNTQQKRTKSHVNEMTQQRTGTNI